MGEKGDQIRASLSHLTPASKQAAAQHLGSEARRNREKREEAVAKANAAADGEQRSRILAGCAPIALGLVITIVVIGAWKLFAGKESVEQHRERFRRHVETLIP